MTSITITEALPPSASATGELLNCNGDTDGNIELTITNGLAPFKYDWDNDGTGDDDDLEDLSGLPAGTYNVTVTDANNCTATASATISQPTAISILETHVNISCKGDDNGSIDITASGGTGTLTFDWGGGVTTEDRTGLAPGSYTVTVTDDNSCTATATISITEPNLLTASATDETLTCFGDSDGNITLTVNGGTTAYSFDWDDNSLDGIQNPSGITVGNYNVTVTNSKGCTATASATISQPADLNVNDYTAQVCTDDAGAVNMNDYNGDITSESGTIVWYLDAALTNPVSGAPPVTAVTNGQIVYGLFTETSTGCTKVGRVTMDVNIAYCPLPVELQLFEGVEAGCNNILTWITATEENVSHFEVEKSTDGLRYETIGEVIANGSSNSLQSYTVVDEYVTERNNYYRLKIIDNNGDYDFSDIIHLRSSCHNDLDVISLYPNPVENYKELTLKIETETANPQTQLIIYDIHGRPVIKEIIVVEKGGNVFKLNTTLLSAGNYFLRIESENISESLPFIVIKN